MKQKQIVRTSGLTAWLDDFPIARSATNVFTAEGFIAKYTDICWTVIPDSRFITERCVYVLVGKSL